MARNRQIGPAARSAPVARIAPPSSAQVQAEYRAMLSEELGPAVFNREPSRDDGRPVGFIRLMLRPAGLFGLALIALFAVMALNLWREGVIESYRVKAAASVPVADKGWMLGDKVRLPSPKTGAGSFVRLANSSSAPADPATDPSTEDAPDRDDQPE